MNAMATLAVWSSTRNKAWPLTCVLWVAVFGVIPALPASAQQTPGSSQTNKSSSLKTVFSYRIESRYGTTSSVNVSGGATGTAEAILNLKSGTTLTNKFGDGNGNASAVFLATPQGANVELKGITGENLFLIDDGTSFRTSVEAPEGGNSTKTGTASAYATHSSSVIVEQGTQSFESTFQQTF